MLVFVSCAIIVCLPICLLQELLQPVLAAWCAVPPRVCWSSLVFCCFPKRKYFNSQHGFALQIWEEARALQDLRREHIYEVSKWKLLTQMTMQFTIMTYVWILLKKKKQQPWYKTMLEKEQLVISLGRFYPISSWLMLRGLELTV